MASANVAGTFTGDYDETVLDDTNSSGLAVLETVRVNKGSIAYTFCVDDVSGGPTYDPGQNAETCESF